MFKHFIKFILLIPLLLGLQSFFQLFINDYVTQIVITIGINILMAASLNLISGFTGQFSLGHAGFMAIGAYVSAALSVYLAPSFGNVWFVQQGLFFLFLIA